MYKEFEEIEQLFAFIDDDKASGDSRYPIRFVLFDGFEPCNQFVNEGQHRYKWNFINIVEILNSDESFPSRSNVFSFLKKEIDTSATDSVVMPFSELARFYNNNDFCALISGLKLIENGNNYAQKRRIYIPLVGLKGRMSNFIKEIEIKILYYKSPEPVKPFNLTITKNTFGVKGLEKRYTVVNSLRQWLNIWRDSQPKKDIISLSAPISGLRHNATPDNAFEFAECNSVYDFLTKCLKLDFYGISYKSEDEPFWQKIASDISVENFDFEKYIASKFDSTKLTEDSFFLKSWIDNKDDFHRWLLKNYYCGRNKGSYICQCFMSENELSYEIANRIFLLSDSEKYINQRLECLKVIAEKEGKLPSSVEEKIADNLKVLADNYDEKTALKFFTPYTKVEKIIALEWLRDGRITLEQVEDFFPALVAYSAKTTDFSNDYEWISEYLDLYKKSKIQNRILPEMQTILSNRNKDEHSFSLWYSGIKTTKTVLSQINDIDVYYWIDGLGIEWAEYIKSFFKGRKNLFLNRFEITRALVPSVTGKNKTELEAVAGDRLFKTGDLDEHAHNINKFPQYIVEEFEIIDCALNEILEKYDGKKIAIVSDHGLTAMSQFSTGLNLSGLKSHHGGRFAEKESPQPNFAYKICDDDKTLCALRYESLCAKIPTGQSAHGGCTPEEVLVPIFILSPEENKLEVRLLTTKLSEQIKCAEFVIQGLTGSETISAEYNGKTYKVVKNSDDKYKTEELMLSNSVKCITLIINGKRYDHQVAADIAAEENDMFDF